MYEVLVTATVKNGCEERFEQLAQELRAATLGRDRGCHRYDWYRGSSGEPGDTAKECDYFLIEAWQDEACLVEHSRSEHLLRLVPQLKECLEGSFKQQRLWLVE